MRSFLQKLMKCFIQSPFQLVKATRRQDWTQQFTITPEGIDFLKNIQSPIAVVSVTGLRRTGKSYLANNVLLNRKKGFNMNDSYRSRSTKGLWCWGTPIKGRTAEGQTVNIIIIDTEGLQRKYEEKTKDIPLLNLAMYLSSNIIYNEYQFKQEKFLPTINPQSRILQLMHEKLNKILQSEDNSDESLPNFHWVIRDALKWKNIDILKEYVRESLKQSCQKINLSIKDRYKHLSQQVIFNSSRFYSLCKPTQNEQLLKDLSIVNFDNLNPQFLKQTEDLRSSIFKNIKIKTLQGQQLNGKGFCLMLMSYLRDINQGLQPNIGKARRQVGQSDQGSKQYVDMAYSMFKERVNLKSGLQEEELLSLFRKAELEAFQYFQKRNDRSKLFYGQKQLRNLIQKRKSKVIIQNQIISRKLLLQYVDKNSWGIILKLKTQKYASISEYITDIMSLLQKFYREGPKLPYHKLFYNNSFQRLQFMGKIYFQHCAYNTKIAIEIIDQIQKQFSQGFKNKLDTFQELHYKVAHNKFDRKQVIPYRNEFLKRESLGSSRKSKKSMEDIIIEYQILNQEYEQFSDSLKKIQKEKTQQSDILPNQSEAMLRNSCNLTEKWKIYTQEIMNMFGVNEKWRLNNRFNGYFYK